jgi:glycerol-3-phosphate dehydrogenase (NAD(P)+)
MNVSIFGSGTWGTALAQVLTDNGHDVLIYGINKDQVDDININHLNSFYFGQEVYLNSHIKATTDIEEAIDFSDIYIVSVPTAALRSLLSDINEKLSKSALFVNTAKGFDTEKVMRISDVIRESIDARNLKGVVSLIGPSHAEEVVVRMLTMITATSLNIEDASTVQALFANDYMRVYTQTDEVGAELGVAYKNAIALASGALAGLGYGDNARAALITRGLAEMVRFGMHFGGDMATYMGLTGLGDLIVTCNSQHSRNFQAGYQIGKEDSAAKFLSENTKTVEGVRTTKIIHEVAKNLSIKTPIIDAIYSVIYEQKRPSETIKLLMNRPLKSED